MGKEKEKENIYTETEINLSVFGSKIKNRWVNISSVQEKYLRGGLEMGR